jgi:hypothetical protein
MGGRTVPGGQEPGRTGPLPGADLDRLAPHVTLAMLALAFLMASAAAAAPAPAADPWHNAHHGASRSRRWPGA